MNSLAALDHQYLWHPFTQMRDWLKREPIVITEGEGSVLRDVKGREYLDANASIWTNLHGHRHPALNAALQRQLKRIAHSSALGLANGPAALLAEQLVRAANPFAPTVDSPRSRRATSTKLSSRQQPPIPAELSPRLGKVFFSDDGSTAMEVVRKRA